ncbi:MAG TPA: F0F1 ATP synthase subunit A, partial [Gemmatimonadales bacterium]|nr:F0F1 ATP synthase subunit A [Gemmatimonadales bacterium]
MTRIVRWLALVLTLTLLQAGSATPAMAQGHESAGQAEAERGKQDEIDILHHIGNSHEIELPFGVVIHLPRWQPVQVGKYQIDLSLTKHTVFMMFAALIVALVFILSGRAVQRAQRAGKPPRGFASAMEATALWVRQDVVLPNAGPHSARFAPYILTLFFFILTMNLLGVLPWGATPTGNLSVTAALAVIAFFVIEISGMRALGVKGYLGTIFFLPHGLPGGVAGWILKPIMLIIMTPIEIIGKLAKPFALAVRLFANMTAGHVLVLALIGLTFIFKSFSVGIASSLMATGIMLLEVFVAFLQAYVFALLTAVFIGLMQEAH